MDVMKHIFGIVRKREHQFQLEDHTAHLTFVPRAVNCTSDVCVYDLDRCNKYRWRNVQALGTVHKWRHPQFGQHFLPPPPFLFVTFCQTPLNWYITCHGYINNHPFICPIKIDNQLKNCRPRIMEVLKWNVLICIVIVRVKVPINPNITSLCENCNR